MNKSIGIIVDGEGDVASLNAKYKGRFRVLKTDGPRGHYAPAKKILSKGQKQISMLKALNCTKVVLMIDLESRDRTWRDLIKELEIELREYNFGVDVSFAVPNRMIENWYLADISHLSKKKAFLKKNISQKNYEGTDGKSALKRLFKKNHAYSETVHGPQLFILIRDSIACSNSDSYKHFLNEVGLLKNEAS